MPRSAALQVDRQPSPVSKAGRRAASLPALLAALSLACGSDEPAADPAAPAGASQPVRTVVTAAAEEVVLRDVVRLSAEVEPWAAVTVAAEATGRVVEVAVDVGDRVAAGDLLVRVDAEEVRAQLAQAEAQVAEAEATLRQAERDFGRGRQLAETQDISRGELDRLELARDTAAARLEAARASVRLRRTAVAHTETLAPFAGVVSERSVEVGSWTAPGSPLVRLVDQSRLKVRGSASQEDRARLARGMPARVTADALPGVVWEGDVRLLGQEADDATGTYLVEVAVPSPRAATGRAAGSERLLPGMQGAVEVVVGERRALVVPRAARVSTAAGEGVFVVDSADDSATARFLEPAFGGTSGDQLEILSGLAAGSRVVVVGQHVLHDGDPIRVEPIEVGS